MPSSENCGNALSSSIEPERYLYRGNSMFRLFSDGDIVVARPVSFDEVRRGDVVVFSRNGDCIVHRVWRKNATFLETIGDNNPRPDPDRIGRDDALALVIGRIDRRKRFSAIARGGRGMFRFACNRLRRVVRSGAAKVFHALWKVVDWRKDLPEPERFGDDFCYFAAGRLIARRRADRNGVVFVRLRDHLKYRSR